MKSILIAYVIYDVLGFIYIAAANRKRRFKMMKHESLFRLVVTVFLPFAGLLYVVAFEHLNKNPKVGTIDDHVREGINSDSSNSYLRRPDVIKEKNIVPIEEALFINNEKIKRMLMTNVLKQDTNSSIWVLKKALQDKDTETSHYAAAALMEIKRKLTLSLQELDLKFENDKNDIDISKTYAGVIKKYIESGMLDEKSIKSHRYQYINVLKSIIKLDKENTCYFVEKINTELELEEFENVFQSCSEFMEEHSGLEEPYLMYLKLYYLVRDSINFRKVLETLRNSRVKLTYNALCKIRFWIEEGA
jgi:hypothetical protein